MIQTRAKVVSLEGLGADIVRAQLAAEPRPLSSDKGEWKNLQLSVDLPRYMCKAWTVGHIVDITIDDPRELG